MAGFSPINLQTHGQRQPKTPAQLLANSGPLGLSGGAENRDALKSQAASSLAQNAGMPPIVGQVMAKNGRLGELGQGQGLPGLLAGMGMPGLAFKAGLPGMNGGNILPGQIGRQGFMGLNPQPTGQGGDLLSMLLPMALGGLFK